jgi:CRP-like cAMP-binding protein
MSALLLQSIRSLVPVSDDQWQRIEAATQHRSFKKDEFISREGEINRFTNFIESGSLRVFHIDSDGQERVIQLGVRGWWASDFASFTNQQPGLLQVQALEQTELLSFSYPAVHQLFEELPVFERFYRLLIQRAYAAFQNRMLQNLSMDAEQRYLQFRQLYPELNDQIFQKHIASYLGMSAEFLSKIKKRVYELDKQQKRTTKPS